MRIVSKQQVMSLLKARKINIKDFDYIENETTDEDIAKTPSIVKYKRWWENQVLWGILFKNKMNDIIKYFIDEHIMSTDIIKASIVTKYDKKFTSRLIELYIDTNDFTDEEKSRIIDSVLLSILSTNDTAYFGKICKYAEDNNIKPMFGTFGNVGNGDGLVGVAKLDNGSKLLAKLLDCGADPSKCNSISLPIAIKHGNYEDAMRLIDHGADIHANNDLAFKTLLKNDEKRFCKKGEEMFHNLLAKRLQEKQ